MSEPATGKALFAWVRETEARGRVGLLKYLNAWARLRGYPRLMVDWSAEQVRAGYAEAVRKLGGQKS